MNDLDNLIDEKNLIEESIIEDVEKEDIKEDVKGSSTKSINLSQQTFNSRSSFRNYLISNFNGGSNCKFELYFSSNYSMNVRELYILAENEKQEQFIFYIQDYSSVNWTSVNVVGNSLYEFVLFSADNECVGISVISRNSNNEINKDIASLSVSPIVGQSSGSGGSDIDYTEYLETIIERLEGIEEDVQSISSNIVSLGNGSGNGNNNQTGSITVSGNGIMEKHISDYTVSEGLLLFVSLSMLIAGVVYFIKRGIPKWH